MPASANLLGSVIGLISSKLMVSSDGVMLPWGRLVERAGVFAVHRPL